jgi:hypothetical protein
MTIKTQDGKVITQEGKVSCECCCFCREYDLDLLLYGVGTGGLRSIDDFLRILREECGDVAAWEALQPDGRYSQREACFRWLCRKTVISNGQPITISNSVGGPTTNNRDLNDLLFDCMGERSGFPGLVNGDQDRQFPPEEYGRCYLYGFEFYGWHRKRREGPEGWTSDWISSDFFYDIYRRDTPIPIEQ